MMMGMSVHIIKMNIMVKCAMCMKVGCAVYVDTIMMMGMFVRIKQDKCIMEIFVR